MRGVLPIKRKKRETMKSAIVKRSVSLAGHKTSISLEDAFWNYLREIAEREKLSVQALIGRIDAERGEQNLSSAIRLFVLEHACERVEAAEHGPHRTNGVEASVTA